MKQVLVVDDSISLQASMDQALSCIECDVISARNESEGLSQASSDTHFDAIIVDLHTPFTSGLNLCAEIRKIPRHADTLMIMLITDLPTPVKQQSKELGVKLWIVKPIDYERLKLVMTKMLDTVKK